MESPKQNIFAQSAGVNSMAKKTKRKMVEEYLIQNRSISPLEAINEFWVTRLSAVIYDLKAAGWLFKTTREMHTPTGSYFARYTLVALPANY